MKKLKINEQGFSLIEISIVIVVIVLICTAGWLVYRNDHKNTSTSASVTTAKKTTTTPPVKTKSTTTTSQTAGWLTYTNTAAGFSIEYPQAIYADNGCTFYQTTNAYGTTLGNVPATVIQNNNDFYIIAKTTYQLALTWGAGQTTTYSGCSPVPTTISTIQAQGSQNSTGSKYLYSAVNLKFSVEHASNQSQALTDLESIYSDSTITVVGWKSSSSGNYEVPTSITCSQTEVNNQTCEPLSSNYDIRFYPSQEIVFVHQMGQGANLVTSNEQVADMQILSSFKPLN